MTTLTVPNRTEFVRPTTAFLVQAARAFGVPRASDSVFEVAISEAITNAVKHGSQGESSSTITCQIELDQGSLTLRIIDDGSGFVVRAAAPPDVSRERLETLPASGYGLPIIRTVFPIVRVITVDGRFALELGLPAIAES
ncbi:MAG TPA: ATP-binding protein [Vicinamibacterales bacterium]|nr:ATP-binding protein [Vicinamibacterales bacterium]